MPAEVESGFAVVQNGSKDREVPWHRLGTFVPDVLTAKEALVTAGLDWEVELYPIFAKVERTDKELWVPVPNQFAVVRDKDDAFLGEVGSHYRPVQNYKAFEMFDAIVADGDAKYETAWSLSGGRIVAITAKVPKHMLVGGVDPVDLYLVLTTTHDGSRALTGVITHVRVVCQNTLNMALGSAVTEFRIRHTQSAETNIQKAREALQLTFKSSNTFEIEANKMIEQEFTKAEFEKLVEQLVPAKDEDDSSAMQVQRALIGTLESSRTLDDGFRYTKWGAFNAVAEYADWVQPIRASRNKTADEQRTEAILFGKAQAMKKRSLQLLKADA